MMFDLPAFKLVSDLNAGFIMKSLIPLALSMIMVPGLLLAQPVHVDNSTVSMFNLKRYLGTWYEIARFDHSFERGMSNVMAEYLLRDDGKIDVLNSGWKAGNYKVAEGKAKQPDPVKNPARLKVSFFLFFYSEYNVLMLDENYQIALVGSKGKDYLWILSRTPFVEDAVLGPVLEEAERRGYDTSGLIWVDQAMNIATL